MSKNINHHQLPLFEFDGSNSKKLDSKGDSEFSKYIVYVDESGDHSLQSVDDNYPIFVLAFCVFHKRHYSESIVPALEKFKFNFFGHDQLVLHENEIRRRKNTFKILNNRSLQTRFLDDLTEIIEFSNFILISTTIDKREIKRLNPEENAYHIALGMCMESLYELLFEKQQHEKKTHIVVECRGNKEDKELELEFRRVCDGNNKFKRKLPFEIIFSDKKVMSSGLQLADLVARPIGLNLLKPEQPNRAFNILKKKFFCSGGRNCLGEGYEDFGMKIYPYPKSEKPR